LSGELRILEETGVKRMTRRELAQRLLAGVAAGMLPPVFSRLHSVYKVLPNAVELDLAAEVAGGAYKPVFLSMEQLAALDKLCEAIVPGSHRAQSAEFLDSLMSVETAEHQQELAASLSAMAAAAEQSFQKTIEILKGEELHQVLQRACSEQSSDYAHFKHLKQWAVAAYYSSEMGMRELGWTPDRVFASYPVCAHEESHS